MKIFKRKNLFSLALIFSIAFTSFSISSCDELFEEEDIPTSACDGTTYQSVSNDIQLDSQCAAAYAAECAGDANAQAAACNNFNALVEAFGLNLTCPYCS